MCLAENKKVLLLVEREQEIDYEDMKQRYHILQEEMIILESDELDRIQPFGDLMRDILIYVYEKNIEEIFIVNTKAIEKTRKISLYKRKPHTYIRLYFYPLQARIS